TAAIANCPNEHLLAAFKVFLKHFYTGAAAFEEIDRLEVGFLVWKMGNVFLEPETVQQQIEPNIARLIEMENLPTVYRFIKAHQLESLKSKWSEFIFTNSHQLAANDRLALSCDEIDGDIDLLDHYLE